MKLSKNTWFIIIILGLSILTRFAFWGSPAETVFDEVHFGKFVDGYYTGKYSFDIHPPLGKLLIAGFVKLGGYQAGDFSFDKIGEGFQDSIYLFLRFLPTLAGVLLPLILYLIALRLGISRNGAAFIGILAVFDNALITQSRFILMDAFLLLFGFTAVYYYLKKNLLMAGIFAALAGSIKWTGFSFLGLIGILFLFALIKEKQKLKNIKNGIIYLISIPLLVYFLIFTVHFALLPNPGPGDPFMSPDFRNGELNTFEKFKELNQVMYTANKNLSATHPFSSSWYQWPLNQKPIFYWSGENNTRIYLLGNPLIWLLAFSSIIITFLVRRKTAVQKFLLFAFFLNWLPFILIGRVMFLYHYFTALIFAMLALAYLLDKKIQRYHYVILTLAVVLTFLFFSPLTYGMRPPEFFNPVYNLFI